MSRRLLLAAILVATASLAAWQATSSAPLTAAERAAVVSRAAEELDRGYVFAAVGKKMADRLRQRLTEGAYETIADPESFADALTRDARSVSDDGHLRIVTRSPLPGVGNAARLLGQRAPAVEGAERLAGNVGYVRVNGFPSPDEIGPALDRAMTTLRDTGAMIVDLRTNGGGDPAGAMYLAGFFFAKPTLMARIYSRQGDTTSEMSTADVTGPRYLGKPLFILTSHRTFSAGEAAAYHLKYVAHAITVGEPSGGGAHRIRGVDLDDRFSMSLPCTRPINVVTNGDWEGTGVTPEIPSSADAALTVAHLAALRKLSPSPERDAAIRDLERGKLH
jgi:retinol-binding protein 3